MKAKSTYQQSTKVTAVDSFSLFTDFGLLVKFRLSMLVVITSIGAFYISAGLQVTFTQLFVLGLGGFLITAASNIINQVLEKDFDALMDRTSNRPLVQNKMTTSTAVLLGGVFCLTGITLLGMFNPVASFFGMFAFILYAFVYTPLKRYSRVAVFVGAIAGAMPMLIGSVAFFGGLTQLGLCLFLLQFAWQFPHFWSIAFLSFDDYDKAGFSFIPKNSSGTLNKNVAVSAIAYAVGLIVLSIYMYNIGLITVIGFGSLMVLCLIYLFHSSQFYRYFDISSAKSLMFSSLAFIPLTLIILIIDTLL